MLTRPDRAASTIDPTSARPDDELPGYVPDPTEVKVPPVPPMNGTAEALVAAGVSSTSRDRYIAYDNWLNVVIARYHFVVGWSYNGTSVIGQPSS
ncbi:hypothetical protein [Pedococcus sp. 5OH_020]|uniref:hypothetical protein n=1 Tax=Pedococcus sp. 5OH_020 TaxID=2989814 RepID=UPI0022E9CA34|nr:hypothetical protein [Pedococcus sp. 5OH_020]